VESDVVADNSRARAIICVGPSPLGLHTDFPELRAQARQDAVLLPNLVKIANGIILSSRPRPTLDSTMLSGLIVGLTLTVDSPAKQYTNVTVTTNQSKPFDHRDTYRTLDWDYDKWVAPGGLLSAVQQRILESDAVLNHPVRLVGPARARRC
jgi:hypothetical protein